MQFHVQPLSATALTTCVSIVTMVADKSNESKAVFKTIIVMLMD